MAWLGLNCCGNEQEPEKLNRGTNDEIAIQGFVKDWGRVAVTTLACVATGGLLLLVLTWRASFRLWCTHRPSTLDVATKILCTDIYGQEWEEDVASDVASSSEITKDGKVFRAPPEQPAVRFFVNKKIKYVWDNSAQMFIRLRSYESTQSLQGIYNNRHGLISEEVDRRKKLFGENLIKIEVLSIPQLLWQQIKNPFYVFQVYTIILWCLQFYYIYAICIGMLSVLSIASSVWETRRQSSILREAMTSQCEMTVIRRNGTGPTVMSSREVVPGDTVILLDGMALEVDVALIDGAAVVNEAILTGESVPIIKVGLSQADNPQQIINDSLHKMHILYSGSEILQLRAATYSIGVVLNTGFSTCRGELVRSILFPKPIAFHLYSDFMKMLGCFVVLGFGAMAGSIYMWLHTEPPATLQEVIFNSLDLLTFVIPPILPATMTAINVWAQRRLKENNIYCVSSNYISLAGPVDVVCFDKTGTLTEDDLELACVVPCSEDGFFEKECRNLRDISAEQDLLRIGLGSCHTLTHYIRGAAPHTLIGHPMELRIFESLDWELEERKDGCINPDYGILTPVLLRPSEEQRSSLEVAQIKTFPFDANDQRMTVVAQIKGSKEFHVFIKGAGETLKQICHPSKIPGNFDEVLTWYSLQGLRVVALAVRSWSATWHEVESKQRVELESEARLLGLVLFVNPTKRETPLCLSILHHAHIDTVMITGDSLATAISVARSCGLVKTHEQMVIVRTNSTGSSVRRLEVSYNVAFTATAKDDGKIEIAEKDGLVFVMDGHTWDDIRRHDRKLLAKLALRGRVFARMKPDQKVQIIEELRDLGRHVAMCGDGCNDCGALKAAHVGVSLAATEASVAAPFTSKDPSIKCMDLLIREGRATLVSTYASFKYNISYGFASLIVVMILYSIRTEPSDAQYLIMDLVLITVPSLVLGNTAAPQLLGVERPTRRILHPLHISSILSFLLIQAGAFWLCFWFTMQQPWFEEFVFVPGQHPHSPSFEGTALVIYSFYTFINGAVCFSHSTPYRKSFYTNHILTAYLLLATSTVIFFTFFSGENFLKFMNFIDIPDAGFRWVLFLGALINLLVCLVWERLFLYGAIAEGLMPWLDRVLPPRLPYQKLEKKIQSDNTWPVITDPNTKREAVLSLIQPLALYQEDNEINNQVLMMKKLDTTRDFTTDCQPAPEDHYTQLKGPRLQMQDSVNYPLLGRKGSDVVSSFSVPLSRTENGARAGDQELPKSTFSPQNYQGASAPYPPVPTSEADGGYQTLDFSPKPAAVAAARPPPESHYVTIDPDQQA